MTIETGCRAARVLGFLLLTILVAPCGWAQVNTMGFQGFLVLDGTPVSGIHTIQFGLYDQAAGGAALWMETQDVAVDEGHFSVELGAHLPFSPDDFFNNQNSLWIEMSIGGNALSPRTKLHGAGFAIFSQTCGTSLSLEGYELSEFLPFSGMGDGSGVDADLLDGLDSTDFLPNTTGSGSGLDADLLDGLDSTAFLPFAGMGAGSGVDADLLDGHDSTDFLPYSGMGDGSGVDADLLDGLESTDFLPFAEMGSGSGVDADLLDGYEAEELLPRELADNSGNPAPNVSGVSLLTLQSDFLTLTNLVGARAGQCVVLVATVAGIRIVDAAPFQLTSDWDPGINETLSLCYSGATSTWYETGRTDLGPAK